mmetsp:Transcript_85186/g.221907  ORF Transcript_85186/g.221907 Transcript_85186/m.221907 type:complete len:477 (+) Transcript_85186:2-1432(+)
MCLCWSHYCGAQDGSQAASLLLLDLGLGGLHGGPGEAHGEVGRASVPRQEILGALGGCSRDVRHRFLLGIQGRGAARREATFQSPHIPKLGLLFLSKHILQCLRDGLPRLHRLGECLEAPSAQVHGDGLGGEHDAADAPEAGEQRHAIGVLHGLLSNGLHGVPLRLPTEAVVVLSPVEDRHELEVPEVLRHEVPRVQRREEAAKAEREEHGGVRQHHLDVLRGSREHLSVQALLRVADDLGLHQPLVNHAHGLRLRIVFGPQSVLIERIRQQHARRGTNRRRRRARALGEEVQRKISREGGGVGASKQRRERGEPLEGQRPEKGIRQEQELLRVARVLDAEAVLPEVAHQVLNDRLDERLFSLREQVEVLPGQRLVNFGRRYHVFLQADLDLLHLLHARIQLRLLHRNARDHVAHLRQPQRRIAIGRRASSPQVQEVVMDLQRDDQRERWHTRRQNLRDRRQILQPQSLEPRRLPL